MASITNVLKTIFSRENSTSGTSVDGKTGPLSTSVGSGTGKVYTSQSQTSLHKTGGGGGTMKITDQVIEEVDEQLTITSMGRPAERPSVKDIFPEIPPGRPPASEPVDVPMGKEN